MSENISVEVAYALPEKQRIVKLEVPQGTTALEAVTLSKLDEVFDELVVGPDLKIGVWGKRQPRIAYWRQGSVWRSTGRYWSTRKRCEKRVRPRPKRPELRVVRTLRTPLTPALQIEGHPSWGHRAPQRALIRLPQTRG